MAFMDASASPDPGRANQWVPDNLRFAPVSGMTSAPVGLLSFGGLPKHHPHPEPAPVRAGGERELAAEQ
ncbi:hypothetical protein GCM10023067_43330 [Aminobacter aganoensis]